MITTIPELTQNFVNEIIERANKGNYEVKVGDIDITVFPYVFPPQSPFSESSHSVHDEFGNLTGKKVLDIGTGTGIQAIKSVKAGAKHVDATDIYYTAVECAKYNVKRNSCEERVNVYESDLFSNIPENNRYDLIIANLPIVDHPEEDIRFHSLFDPNFQYHRRLFKDAPDYLTENGRITLCHTNLCEKASFSRLEDLAEANGFSHNVIKSTDALGYDWRAYNFEIAK